jgi:hypothetical protein
MPTPNKAKMVAIKTANRIKNLKSTGSSASAKASKAELEAKGGVYTSKDVTKGAKAVEVRRKIDLGKTLARANSKTPKSKMNPSEKEFIKGQKVKAKITKKTGKYPNTAN